LTARKIIGAHFPQLRFYSKRHFIRAMKSPFNFG
jgi:hypothetical protein